MSELSWDSVPTLQRPLVVVAFRGLFDAATSATAAVEWLRDRYESERIAVIDPECYFDFQQERPVVTIDERRAHEHAPEAADQPRHPQEPDRGRRSGQRVDLDIQANPRELRADRRDHGPAPKQTELARGAQR